MPEGPEVRRYADELGAAIVGKKIVSVSARTKNARAWLANHNGELVGQKILKVFAHGKNIIGITDGDYFFYSHQMMWGRWHIMTPQEAAVIDKRERARIEVKSKTAVLMSAPIFEVGAGDPYAQIKYLRNLGPNILSCGGSTFDVQDFLRRLELPEHKDTTIGAALLDQSILAGIGNYLRAEILFLARVDPWMKVKSLKSKQKKLLSTLIPEIAERSYKLGGVTVTDELHTKMQETANLVYVPGKEYGTHHYVFRRTNLPCLVCEESIRQLRQLIPAQDEEDEKLALKSKEKGQKDGEAEDKSRIIYFCPNCQSVDFNLAKLDQPKMSR